MPDNLLILPRDWRVACLAALLSIAGVVLWIVIVDLCFRRWLPPEYVQFYTSPILPRTVWSAALSVIEELKYRLILMTLLVALIGRWRRDVPASAFVAVIVISQLANVWPLVVAYPVYASLRFWIVGCVWGHLYWRFGWATAALAHGVCHFALDPALAYALLHT
jgi:hypothetical protein